MRDCQPSIIAGPFAPDELPGLAAAYDEVLDRAEGPRFRRGSTSIRMGGFAARDPFWRIWLHPPLLEAAARLIGGPFKLSSFHARSLMPGVEAQPLHQDVAPGADGDPLAAFIFMLDAFTPENGATRFATGSGEQPACGPAGSLIVYDGTAWHEHGANRTCRPRRSLQGAFISRVHTGAVRWSEEVSGEAAARLPVQARQLLGL